MSLGLSPAFKFPSRESQPLQSLSPERVNGSRPTSSLSTMTSKSSAKEFDTENSSPRSSPTRKTNLFAGYNPNARANAEKSIFPPPSAGTASVLPTSPSLPEMSAFSHHVRTNSDVQGLVKRFEHLDVRDREAEYGERRKRHELELSRAQIAREEAESDVQRLKEELRRIKKDCDEGRDRERKVGKRLEVVMEEYSRSKETHASQISVYEKEVRKSRKEAFKSSSAVVKLQEDLKSTRNSLRVTQSNLDMEKRKVQYREQETFDAQYQLVSVQEELDKLKTELTTVQEEKEALKTALKEEEVARIAAEGMIALPASQQDDDDLIGSPRKHSPKKRPESPLSDDKENAGVVTKKMIDTRRLREELASERMRREHAEELAEFLGLECQFQCCRCRTSGKRDHGAIGLSSVLNEAMDKIRSSLKEVMGPATEQSVPNSSKMDIRQRRRSKEFGTELQAWEKVDVEMEFSSDAKSSESLDQSLTMANDTPEEQLAREQVSEDKVLEYETPKASHPTPIDSDMEVELTESTTKVPLKSSSPHVQAQPQPTTPFRQQSSMRTITTTTMIPMQFTPSKPAPPVFDDDAKNFEPAASSTSPRDRSGSAPAFDREAALAAIAYRRGRAKSMANGHITPRKQMMEGVGMKERRDISAPALGQQKMSGANVPKGAASVGRGVAGSASRRMA